MKIFAWEKLSCKWQSLSYLQKGIIIITIPVTCFAIFPPLVSWNHFDWIEDKEEFYQIQLNNSIKQKLLQSTLNAQIGVKNYLLTQHESFINSYHQALVDVSQLEAKLLDNLSSQEQILESEMKTIPTEYLEANAEIKP